MVERTARIEPYASDDTRPLDAVRRDEGRACYHLAAIDDLDLAEPLPFLHRQRHLHRRDDALDEWPLDVNDAQRRLRRDEPHRGLAVGRARRAVDAVAVDRPHGPIPGEPPSEQRGEVTVAAVARLAAEECRVDRDAAAARGRDL